MKKKQIMLLTIEDAKEFVTLASRCDFDIDVFCGQYVVNAKSILGVLSMDLRKTLNVRFDGENKAFEKFLSDKAIFRAA